MISLLFLFKIGVDQISDIIAVMKGSDKLIARACRTWTREARAGACPLLAPNSYG